MEMPHVLEVDVRHWMHELGVRRLADVGEEAVKAMGRRGMQWLWLMGVWQTGRQGRQHSLEEAHAGVFSSVLPQWQEEDVVGSPYAVQYPCRLLVAPECDCSGLPALRKTLSLVEVMGSKEEAGGRKGMRLMLDFVPNHTAKDCDWVAEMPQWYIGGRAGSGRGRERQAFAQHNLAYGSDGTSEWRDTAQLDYWQAGVRHVMQQQLLALAQVCDGVRCDMAHLCLNDVIEANWGPQLRAKGSARPETEFWRECIAAVKAKHPEFLFVAECYSHHEQLQALGFDHTYHKQVYDRLVACHMDDMRASLAPLGHSYLRHSCHFPAASFISGIPDRMQLLRITMKEELPPGLVAWRRREEGRRGGHSVHLGRTVREDAVQEAADDYQAMMRVLSHPVFRFGAWEYLAVRDSESAWRLVAWRWQWRQERRLVVVNYTSGQAEGRVVLSNAEPDAGQRSVILTELISGNQRLRDVADLRTRGLDVALGPWEAQAVAY